MKKNVLSFVFVLLLISLLKITLSDSIIAQELTPTITLTPTPAVKYVKYDLPYPGILPDHKLYKLKLIRDKLSMRMISDPSKKIDFYLLQADKGMLAAAMLVDQNKFELAETTALKAENNITLISNLFKTTYDWKNTNKSETQDLIKKVKTASLKHQEVLNSLIKRVPKERQKMLKTVIYFSQVNVKEIEKSEKEYDKQMKLQKMLKK